MPEGFGGAALPQLPAFATPDGGAVSTAALGLARQAEAAALAQAEQLRAGGPGAGTVTFNAPLLSGVTVTNEADEIRLAQTMATMIGDSVARVEAPVPPAMPGVHVGGPF